MVTNVGIIGLSASGWAVDAHLAPLKKLSNLYKLTALSTTRESSASEASTKHQVKGYHGDPKQIAQDPNVDLVIVSVKTPHHKESLWPAIEAGKDVFCEWPLGATLVEAEEIAAFAKKKGVRSMIGLQARQSPAVKKAAELVKSGKIGKILSTHVLANGGAWGAQIDERNAYTCDVKNGANMLSIALSHFLDGFACILGDFQSLSATLSVARNKVTVIESNKVIPQTSWDQIAVIGFLQSGATASIHFRGGAGFAQKGGTDLLWEIEGEDGIITLKGFLGHIQLAEPTLFLNGEEIKAEPDDLGNVGREYEAFAKKDTAGYVDFDHAVTRHRIIDAVLKSSKERRVVDL